MRRILASGWITVSVLALLGLTACGDQAGKPSESAAPRAAPAATIGATGNTTGSATGSAVVNAHAPAAASAPASPAAPLGSGAHVDSLGDALPPGAIARLGSNRLRHQSAVVGLAFGLDGRTLVSVGTEGELLEWSVPSGQLLRRFGAPRVPTSALSATSNGTLFALSRLEGDAEVVDGASGLVSPIGADLEHGNNAALSPDGRWLALWGLPFTAVSLLPVAGGPVQALYESIDEFVAVGFDAVGARVALLARQPDGAGARTSHALMSLRDPGSGDVLWRVEVPGEMLYSVAFSPDGQRIFAGDGHGNVRVFDAADGASLGVWDLCATDEMRYPVTSLAVSPDGQRLAVANGRSAVLVDTGSGAVLRTLPGHDGRVYAVAYSPEGNLIATACSDLIVRLFDPQDGRRVYSPIGHDCAIARVLCAPDGRSICTIGANGLCLLWPGDGSGPPRELERAPDVQVSAAYSPDGALLAVGSPEPVVSIYDVASGAVRDRWSMGLAGRALLVAFAPDGSALATTHPDGAVRVWPLTDGHPSATEPSLVTAPVSSMASALAWLPDGRIAVGTSLVRLLDGKTGTTLRSLVGSSPIAEIAVTHDGRLLATANAARSATIFKLDATSAAEGTLHTLGDQKGRVYAVAFSPDGSLVATGCANESLVRLWDVETGTEVAQLAGHLGDVDALAFTADGRALVSAGADAAALVWAIPPVQADSSR